MNSHWTAPTNHPPLASGEAHVWAVPLDPAATQLDSLAAILSTNELRRAADFRLVAPRQRFVATRAALRILLGRYLDARPANVAITVDENNKPRLEEGNHGETALRFNVAHSDKLALIAVTSNSEIGVDIERRRKVRHAEGIARRYFHPAEVAAITASPPAARDAMFLRCWTGKEAVLKALGIGVTGSLAAFQVLTIEDAVAGVIIDVPKSSAARHVHCWLRWLDPDDNYLAAVAVVGSELALHCKTFTL